MIRKLLGQRFLCLMALAALPTLSTADEQPSWLRLDYAKSSESDFATAAFGDFDASEESNYLLGLTWGQQLDARVFDWPLALSANVGLQALQERGHQEDGWGATAFIKLHYDWRLPWTNSIVRLGLGEGLSYVSTIPMSEQRDFATKDVESNNVMNYLEWTVDLPLTQFLQTTRENRVVEELSIGFLVWHRSSVFGLFADEGGGVNFMGLSFEARY